MTWAVKEMVLTDHVTFEELNFSFSSSNIRHFNLITQFLCSMAAKSSTHSVGSRLLSTQIYHTHAVLIKINNYLNENWIFVEKANNYFKFGRVKQRNTFTEQEKVNNVT